MDEASPEPGNGERKPGYGQDLRLGTALSISGAAASPNMGYHSSPAVTFLMTVFNARLGWWLGNPAREKWCEPGPRSGFYLFKELFGRTNANSKYIYLSDGGHFENLGVYELYSAVDVVTSWRAMRARYRRWPSGTWAAWSANAGRIWEFGSRSTSRRC